MKPGFKQTEVGMIPEDWEIRRLSDIAVANWGNTSITKNSYQESGYQAYSASGPDGYVGWYEFDFPAVILSAIGAQCGKTWLAKGKWTPIKNTIWFTAKEGAVNTPYLFRITGDPGFWPNRGQAQPFIALNDVRDSRIPLPPTLAEQEAIASALGDADALIESLERLIAKKRDVKQGAMQELLTARRRLPGFTGKWETKRFGQFGYCIRGVGYNPDADLSPCDTPSSIRLLRANNVQNASIVFSDLQYVNSRRVAMEQRLRPKDVLICMANGSKDLVGKAGQFLSGQGYDYTFGAFMGCFRPDAATVDPDLSFFMFQTEAYRKHIAVLLAGTSINNLNPGNVENYEMLMPCDRSEQTAIATVLSDMDAELAALEAKLAKARAIKQGMMQELLTGRIRLK